MEKNVCLLTSVHPPFDTRIFHREAKSLAKAGYQVYLIAPHTTDEVREGIRIIPVIRSKKRIWRMLGTVRIFALALKQRAIIYHFHDPELLPVGVLLKIFTGRRVIYDVHEHYPNAILAKYWIPRFLRKMIKGLFEFQESILVPFLDCVVYTTPLVGRRYQKMAVRTVRLENYATPESFEKTPDVEQKYRQAKEGYLLYLGGVIEIRGILEMIRGFSLVSRKYPQLKLYLVGDVSPESFHDKLDSLIADLGITEQIVRIRHLPYSQIESYLLGAILGIVTYLPSPNNMSCLPNKLFEYMASGLPVIASDFELYREVVTTVGYGKLVNPERPEEIAEAMKEMIENPTELKNMARNARQAFKDKYNWTMEAEKLIRIYGLLERSPSRGSSL